MKEIKQYLISFWKGKCQTLLIFNFKWVLKHTMKFKYYLSQDGGKEKEKEKEKGKGKEKGKEKSKSKSIRKRRKGCKSRRKGRKSRDAFKKK